MSFHLSPSNLPRYETWPITLWWSWNKQTTRKLEQIDPETWVAS